MVKHVYFAKRVFRRRAVMTYMLFEDASDAK